MKSFITKKACYSHPNSLSIMDAHQINSPKGGIHKFYQRNSLQQRHIQNIVDGNCKVAVFHFFNNTKRPLISRAYRYPHKDYLYSGDVKVQTSARIGPLALIAHNQAKWPKRRAHAQRQSIVEPLLSNSIPDYISLRLFLLLFFSWDEHEVTTLTNTLPPLPVGPCRHLLGDSSE